MIERGLNVRFIEYMPFDSNGWNVQKMVSQNTVMEQVMKALDEKATTMGRSFQIRRATDTGPSSVGSDYNVYMSPHSNKGTHSNNWTNDAIGEGEWDFCGRVSFVSSMTDKFCSGCNRLRLLADGSLKVCLFGDQKDELSLRDLIRGGASDVDIALAINGALLKKKRAHAGMFEIHKSNQNRAMTSIGG